MINLIKGIFRVLSVAIADDGVGSVLFLEGKKGAVKAANNSPLSFDSLQEMCGELVRITGKRDGDNYIVDTIVLHQDSSNSIEIEAESSKSDEESNPKAMERPKFDKYSLIVQWYKAEYPEDSIAENIAPLVSFKDCFDRMKKGEDFYDIICVADSLARESIFQKMSDILGVGYEELYQLWMVNSHSHSNSLDTEHPEDDEPDEDIEAAKQAKTNAEDSSTETDEESADVEEAETVSEENADAPKAAGTKKSRNKVKPDGEQSLFELMGLEEPVVEEKPSAKEKPKKDKASKKTKFSIDKDELYELIKNAVREVMEEMK